MKTLIGFSLLALATAASAAAQPLTVVHVSDPAINCVFNPTCKVTVQDLSAPVFTHGFLQSRNYRAASGAPAAGFYVYEYRIDLRDVVGVTFIPFITTLTVNVGPNARFDFNGDGRADDIFVVTRGGLGNVDVVSAVRSGANITFTFRPPVAGGSSPGRGDSTFFFGLVSRYPRHNVTATVATNAPPGTLSLNAWAPNHP
jgi:hypothetical protein